MSNIESPEERSRRYRTLTSNERKRLIRKRLKSLGLSEGSGVYKNEKSSNDSGELRDLILITKYFFKNIFYNS